LAQTRTNLYAILRPWIGAGIKVFCKRIVAMHVERIPKNKKVILISNHQNALLDPLIGCIYSTRQLHWLTRADVFKIPAVAKILAKFNMLPVYRERDKVPGIIDKNEHIFRECHTRIDAGAMISLFPEGTHRGKKHIFQLKKGIGRLAFGAIDSGIDPKDILIMPMGLDYSDFFHYHPEVVVNFGRPFPIDQFYEKSKTDLNKGINELLEECKAQLSRLVIDIRSDEGYEDLVYLRSLCFAISGKQDLKNQFLYYQEFIEKVQRHPKLEAMVESSHEYRKFCEKHRIQEFAAAENHSLAASFLKLGLLFPIYLIGRIFFLPIEKLVEGFVRVKIQDPLFKNSIRVAFWTFLTPIYALIVASIASLFFEKSLLSFFYILGGAFIAGLLAKRWVLLKKDTLALLDFRQFKNSAGTKYQEFSALRNELVKAIKNIHNSHV
jgi:1-acyl-sn-glycerol-3-phosphate acyltransferase